MKELYKAIILWKRFMLNSNIKKMKKTLIKYLKEEGIKAYMKDCMVMFEFRDKYFHADFRANETEEYPYCTIYYIYPDNDYIELDPEDKAFVANSTNAETENEVKTLAMKKNLILYAKFYFDGKRMLKSLFYHTFCNMLESINDMKDIIQEKIEQHKKRNKNINKNPNRKIGFADYTENTDSGEEEEQENSRIAGKA